MRVAPRSAAIRTKVAAIARDLVLGSCCWSAIGRVLLFLFGGLGLGRCVVGSAIGCGLVILRELAIWACFLMFLVW